MRSYVKNNNLVLNYDSDMSRDSISFDDDYLRYYFKDGFLKKYDIILIVNACVSKTIIKTTKHVIIKNSEIDDLYIVSASITLDFSYIKTIYSPPKYNTIISIYSTTIECFLRFDFVKKLTIKDSKIKAIYGIYVDELYVAINSTLVTSITQMNCYVQNLSVGHRVYISRSMNLNNTINILCGDEYISISAYIFHMNDSIRRCISPYII